MTGGDFFLKKKSQTSRKWPLIPNKTSTAKKKKKPNIPLKIHYNWDPPEWLCPMLDENARRQEKTHTYLNPSLVFRIHSLFFLVSPSRRKTEGEKNAIPLHPPLHPPLYSTPLYILLFPVTSLYPPKGDTFTIIS